MEGETDGLSAMAIAKRELAAALPLLKPAAKMFAELSDVCEPSESGEARGLLVAPEAQPQPRPEPEPEHPNLNTRSRSRTRTRTVTRHPTPEQESGLFVPATCDASSNMGSAAADVEQLFERITGEALDLDA